MAGPFPFCALWALTLATASGCSLFGSVQSGQLAEAERPRNEALAPETSVAEEHPGNGEESGSPIGAIAARLAEASDEDEKLPFREAMPSPAMSKNAKASQYANLSASACKRAIKERNLPAKDATAKGVATPMRLTGPLHGVRFITAPAPSPFGVADCRLILALDDFAEVLARFDVVSVQLDSMFRSRARIAGKKKMASQHAHGMAADIVAFTFADKRRVPVEGNWGASIGAIPCGPAAVLEERTGDILLLRDIACAVGRSGAFHHLLTPSFDAAHRNHFHFDIKPHTKMWAIR